MTIQEAIKKAIEGGWNEPYFETKDKLAKIVPLSADEVCQKVAFLDLLFWQSLGKAMGWEKNVYEKSYSRNEHSWLYHWHHFIDHLAEGKSIEDFFQNLNAEK